MRPVSTDETSADRTGPDVVRDREGAPDPASSRPLSSVTARATTTPDVPLIPTRSADDSDTGWGERVESNDDRLLRDVPPHW